MATDFEEEEAYAEQVIPAHFVREQLILIIFNFVNVYWLILFKKSCKYEMGWS